MKYPRTFATPDGESHFEDVDVPPEMVHVVPGRPAFESSAAIPTSAATLMHIGATWDGSWHPTPKRWFVFTLAGEMEIRTSDGEIRSFGPGSMCLLDDTTGKGHNTRVLGDGDWYGFGVDLAQQ
ncbi:MAG: cupin domain-containing protein [Chloroflexi bacterium]|nr:cupin domain-containing protein [Chloroflexota bacterium]